MVDFIDMKYGIDMIMELNEEVFLIQVKSKAARSQNKQWIILHYRYIDLFVGESPDKNGIMLYDRDQLQEGMIHSQRTLTR